MQEKIKIFYFSRKCRSLCSGNMLIYCTKKITIKISNKTIHNWTIYCSSVKTWETENDGWWGVRKSITLNDSKRFPRSYNFSFGRRKSHTEPSMMNMYINNKIHEILFHNSSDFWLIFTRKGFNLANWYSFLCCCPSRANFSCTIHEYQRKLKETHLDFWGTVTCVFSFNFNSFLVSILMAGKCLYVKLMDHMPIVSYHSFLECEIRTEAIQHT